MVRRHCIALAALILFAALPVAAESGGMPRCFGRRATIVGTSGPDRLIGTPQRDVIVARGGADRIGASGGDDRICAGSGADRVLAGSGSDLAQGGGNSDRLSGGSGRDRAERWWEQRPSLRGKRERPPERWAWNQHQCWGVRQRHLCGACAWAARGIELRAMRIRNLSHAYAVATLGFEGPFPVACARPGACEADGGRRKRILTCVLAVDPTGIEPVTSAMPWRHSTK